MILLLCNHYVVPGPIVPFYNNILTVSNITTCKIIDYSSIKKPLYQKKKIITKRKVLMQGFFFITKCLVYFFLNKTFSVIVFLNICACLGTKLNSVCCFETKIKV